MFAIIVVANFRMPAKNGMGRHTTPLNVPEAPVFYPTMEEFKDFNKFVAYLETTDAPRAGICRIVPPAEWVPRKIGYKIEDMNYTISGPVRQQFNQVGDKGMYQTKGILKPEMSVKVSNNWVFFQHVTTEKCLSIKLKIVI